MDPINTPVMLALIYQHYGSYGIWWSPKMTSCQNHLSQGAASVAAALPVASATAAAPDPAPSPHWAPVAADVKVTWDNYMITLKYVGTIVNYFPTCQVTASSSSFSSTMSASTSTSTSALRTLRQALRQLPSSARTAGPQPGTFPAQCAPLDLNGQIECQKICQIECQKICQIEC